MQLGRAEFEYGAVVGVEYHLPWLAFVGEQRWIQTEYHSELRDSHFARCDGVASEAHIHSRTPGNAVGDASAREGFYLAFVVNRQRALFQNGYLHLYLSMAIGHLFNRNRVAMSVVAYIAINALVGILIGICIDSNQVGKILLPLLAARPMRRFSDILPLHGTAHKKTRKHHASGPLSTLLHNPLRLHGLGNL